MNNILRCIERIQCHQNLPDRRDMKTNWNKPHTWWPKYKGIRIQVSVHIQLLQAPVLSTCMVVESRVDRIWGIDMPPETTISIFTSKHRVSDSICQKSVEMKETLFYMLVELFSIARLQSVWERNKRMDLLSTYCPHYQAYNSSKNWSRFLKFRFRLSWAGWFIALM